MTDAPRTHPYVIAERPTAGPPRSYTLPPVRRTTLDNGIRVAIIDVPGRPLASASLVVPIGAAEEGPDEAGATVLMARALSEGTTVRDAVAFTEATERLGASIHAEAGWDAIAATLDVPVERLDRALALMAEMFSSPAFPPGEVERLRDERLNDLLQAKADPRRRAEEAFAAAIYDEGSPYHRSAAGVRATVERLDASAVRAIHARRFDPSLMTLVVGGDMAGQDVEALAAATLGAWRSSSDDVRPGPIVAEPASRTRTIRVVHRPGSVQTEIRIGHVGVSRRIPDYHAVAVMSAILGGLFNSRLNRKLREEKGYTYGASAGFDFRRAAGPFGARAAVNTDVTVPAILEILSELTAIREAAVTADEARVAKDYLVGVFPLRFETPGAVVGAIAGLAVHDLPEDELTRYRDAVDAVTVDGIHAAARARLDPDGAAIVLVGDADAFLPALESAGLGPVEVEREPDLAEGATPTG